MLTLRCPSLSDEDGVYRFLKQVNDAISAPRVAIDFTPIRFAKPRATLLVAEALKGFIELRNSEGNQTVEADDTPILGSDPAVLSYLSHVGFFNYIGFAYGKLPNEAPGSPTYLPITVLSRKEILSDTAITLQQAICNKSDHLAEMIAGDEKIQIPLSYSFREIIRNVFEHTDVNYCLLMAQRWGDMIEVAVVDRGPGICATLRPQHPTLNDEELIEHSLLPGISRALQSLDERASVNCGFGLFILSSLGRQFGKFSVVTNNMATTLSQSPQRFLRTSFSGTAVGIVLNLGAVDYFSNVLQSLVRQGEQEIYKRSGVAIDLSLSKILST